MPSREPRKGVTVYSYIVAFDSGFSPNPFHGVCTLACCKPNIRRAARVGDLVVGLSKLGERFVYAMRVDRVVDFTTYWSDRRYACERPEIDALSVIARQGDNIYRPWRIGEFRQPPSRHSHDDGTEDVEAKRKDLSGLHVLVFDTYTFFAREGPVVTPELSFLQVSLTLWRSSHQAPRGPFLGHCATIPPAHPTGATA